MAAPDATPPHPLRQAFRSLVPRPVRAALHAAMVAPTRWPGMIARQSRRAWWKAAEAMSPPRQPGLLFWQVGQAPSRVLNALRRAGQDAHRSARHAGWEMHRSARHAGWEMQRSARHAGWEMQRSARLMRNSAQHTNPLAGLRRLFAKPQSGAAFDRPSFPDALVRMQQHDLGIRSIVNIGAGSGGDTEFVLRIWPDASTLLVEMDARFEPGYHRLKAAIPNIAWDICAAGPHDGMGAMSKTNAVGGSIDPNGDMAASAPVQFKRIDTLVREHGLEAPYFLRFDTHGFELDVLAGATETLAKTALIMMEVYNFKLAYTQGKSLTFDEMSLHMKSLGFRCIDICDPLFRPGDHALWQMHLFFIRADHPIFANPGYSAPPLRPKA
jgi:FkbM family methyltransferase